MIIEDNFERNQKIKRILIIAVIIIAVIAAAAFFFVRSKKTSNQEATQTQQNPVQQGTKNAGQKAPSDQSAATAAENPYASPVNPPVVDDNAGNAAIANPESAPTPITPEEKTKRMNDMMDVLNKANQK